MAAPTLTPFPLSCIAALTILALLSSLTIPCCAASDADPSSSPYLEFVKASCAYTTYPDVCYETLSSYAATIQTSPTELAKEALSVSLNSAQLTSDVVTNLSKMSDLTKRESGAVNDCMEMISDSADELRQSLVAMRDLQGPEFKAQMNNIQTWVSAALTDDDTCMDGFNAGKGSDKGKVKGIIRSNVMRVAQLTSNALALISRLSE
ncbi:hypothetical protein MLD38_033585 [Melastoma candidum]|uniref:Uncharacterized protein n=1 Tax=Melastoma candidum TaxID=119954 RepID=A0ACB9M921_9MYRT|nr:hypothetical protein MLD38_033585 [Melastoma candidum]